MGHWGVQRRPNQPGKPRRASHSGIQETNTYSSTTQSRPVTRTHSCTISTKYSASYLPPEASNLSDYYSTLCSNKATKFYEEHHCSTHESFTPYQHWQNAVIQTIRPLQLMSPLQYRARTACFAQTPGHTHSPTGPAYITFSPTAHTRTPHQPEIQHHRSVPIRIWRPTTYTTQ